MQFIVTGRNDLLSAMVTLVGSSGGKLRIYAGSPTGISNAPPVTLLSTLTNIIFAAPSGGTMTFTCTMDSSAAATGTPGTVRFEQSGGTQVIECTAGINTGEFSFAAGTNLGGTVSETSATVTAGNA